eukprot:sb/3477226/
MQYEKGEVRTERDPADANLTGSSYLARLVVGDRLYLLSDVTMHVYRSMMDMFMLSSVTTINAGLAPKKSTISIDHVKSAFTLQEQGKYVTTIGKWDTLQGTGMLLPSSIN